MSQVLCPIVVGRSEEVRVLDEALAAARSGSGRVLFLLGEAGIGKSRLLREAEGHARDAGMKVLVGRAVPGGSRVPFRPLVEAVQSFTRAAGAPGDAALEPYHPALGWLVPEWAGGRGKTLSPVLMLEAVVRLLRAIAGIEGLLLILDDLHWADADTLSLLEYLSDNVGSEAVLCVGALRSDEPGPARALAERLASRRAASRLVIRRLTDREMQEMVKASLPEADAGGEALRVVQARAEGVPFLVEEMLSEYVESGTVGLPASYRDLVRGRLAGLDSRARPVIEAAAAIGREFEWSLVGAITGLDRDDVLGALRAAIGAHLVTSSGTGAEAVFGFRHALAREAILEELLPPERSDLFLRAADAMEEAYPGLPGDLCQVAADLRERGGDATDASRLLLEVARRALAATALATAEGALWRARELAAGDRWRTLGVDRLLVQVLALSGKTEGLGEIGQAALGFYHDKLFLHRHHLQRRQDQMGELHLQIARGLSPTGQWPLVDTHLNRAEDLADKAGNAPLGARVVATRAHALLARGDLDRAAAVTGDAEDAGRRMGLPAVVSEALRARGRIAFLHGDAPAAVRALKEARRLAQEADLPMERAQVALSLAAIDRATTAGLGNVETAGEFAERTGAVAVRATVDLELARMHVERFEIDRAAEAADRAIQVSRRYGLPQLPWALVARAQILALADDGPAMKRAIDEALDSSGRPEIAAAAWGEAKATLHLVREERAAAARALEAAWESARPGGPSEPWPFQGSSVLLRVVEGESVGTVRRSLRGNAWLANRANQGCLLGAEAIQLGRAGRGNLAVERQARADQELEPFPWRRHHARRMVAEAALRDGWGRPAEWIADSLRFFEAARHERIAAACRGLLRRAGIRVPRKGRGGSEVPEALRRAAITSRETDVLTLVAEGLSNAEIAERLFVSIRTVESHIGSLLRKAGVEGRPQLMALAHRWLDVREGDSGPTGGAATSGRKERWANTSS